MKIYYVALTTDKDTVAKNYSGKRLSLYTKKHEAIKTCVLLNYQWELFFGNGAKEEKAVQSLLRRIRANGGN